MAFELLTTPPSLLREGHIIHFEGDWPDSKKDKWFRVDRAWQIKFDVARIVASADSQDLRFEAAAGSDPVGNTNLALIPDKPGTVYELLMGMKGNLLAYPRYADSFLLSLEKSGVTPSTSDVDLRYLGFYDEEDSPFEAPRLREYTVKDQETPVLRLYNDGTIAEKMVLRFIVNRCKLLQVDPSSVSERERSLVRIAKYHTQTVW